MSKISGFDFLIVRTYSTTPFRVPEDLVIRNLEMLVLRYSKGVIFNGRIAERTFLPVHRNPSVTVSLGYMDLVTPEGQSTSPAVQKHLTPRMLFFGSGWAFDDLPTLFDPSKQLIERYPHTELLHVGINSNNRDRVDILTGEFEISKNVVIIPPLQNFSDESTNFLLSAHVLVLPAQDAPFTRITARYKLFYYLMMIGQAKPDAIIQLASDNCTPLSCTPLVAETDLEQKFLLNAPIIPRDLCRLNT